MYRAKVLFNHRVNNPYMGTAAIAILAAFMAFSVSANTSNPFYINDTMFIFSVMAGIVGGGYSLQKRNAKLNEYAS